MKTKYFIFSFILSLFCFCSIASADEIQYSDTLVQYYTLFDDYISTYDDGRIDALMTYYNNNVAEDYPYYFLVISTSFTTDAQYYLQSFKDSPTSVYPMYYGGVPQNTNVYLNFNFSTNTIYHSMLSFSSNNTINYSQLQCLPNSCQGYDEIFNKGPSTYLVDTNVSLPLVIRDDISPPYNYDYLDIPAFSSSVNSDLVFQHFSISDGNFLPSYKQIFEGSYVPSVSYTSINLNDYAYVALSLKNYNIEPFDTTFMVKGQLCLTPVYDYGMKQKTEYYSGYQIDRCSPVYDTFTPNRVSILKQDIENNSIYYLKAFDTSFDNIIKVDRNVFDITYISQENANNPNVIIGGRSYPTIPYNDLSSSATISEEDGYISGESKNVFDISSDSNFIENLFSNPLQTLGNVWTSIITMFALVGSFIALLPATLQTFLIAGFSIAIVLGVLKILL